MFDMPSGISNKDSRSNVIKGRFPINCRSIKACLYIVHLFKPELGMTRIIPKAFPVCRMAVSSKLDMLSERIVPEPVGEA